MDSSSSSSPRNSNKYEVFLSFKGDDTRDNFTSHLYSALCQNKIETFIDNDLKRGDEISQSLLDTIEASTISIVIFSERYASSGCCLDELLQILECKHGYGQIVIPVFYRVDPSHVRRQTGNFGDFFSKLEERFPQKLQRWRNALTEAANLSGFDSHVIRPESKLIKEITNEILERLDDTFQSDNTDLVGVERPIKEIESLVCTGSAGVYILGIWGMGGIGKTTIADAIFNKISRRFEGSYFVHNVRDAEETDRIKDLQKQLLSKLLNDGNVRNVRFQLKRLARKKVLVVFDDVNHSRQIESLIGRLDQLASGSRVIITTRDKQVLQNCWASQIYEMKELVYVDAHKLFCQYAFRGAHLDASYSKLTHKAIKYAQGVPLALKVLGRHLCGNSKEEWESAMRKLEVIPDVEIQEVLKISYDSLDDSQKNVFLDIAFFLKGERRDVVISFFDAIGFEVKIELSVLDGKSLITCLDNQIRMHDLLREMGREIVRKESIDHSGKRSRLWYHKDICEVLKKNKGTEAIKGISLDMGKANSEIQINPYTFSKMTELRFLKFYGSENKCMVSSLEGVPFTEVRYFEWHQYPLKTLDIHAENLVSLKMPGSKVKQLWDDVQNLVNLKKIDLWYSKLLTKLPDLSLAQNLEILDLGGCSSLTETHSSIQYLNKLEVLDLDRCESLRTLPTSIQSKYLKRLVLRGCSNLKNFPEISSSGIHRLDLTHVGIKELPSSIDRLSKLDTLKIHDCTSLESLPSSLSMFKSLTSLEIIYCPKLKRLPDELGNLKALEELRVEGTAIRRPPESLGQLSSLQILSLSDNSNLERAPESIRHLSKLTSLFISDCKMLQTLPELPCNLHDLDASGCTSLEALPASLSSKFYLSVDLSNCLKLDLSELSEIIKDRWMKQVCL
ncbi:ADP-ribosyl cyclase/cyclic ADP-ribose hydrolase [Citrus sinensis]|nr:ADP-ribosyl cyclase/cyclic ADP-ribose hydrolase [Citrus sinensis]